MNTCCQKGFTLLEVLITMAILAVGLLGLAAMQVVGMRSNNSSTYRTEAVLVASSELVERMQANPVGVAAGLYSNLNLGTGGCQNTPPTCSDYYNGSQTVVTTASCTSAQMAAFDIDALNCGTYHQYLTSTRAIDGLRLVPNSTLTVQCQTNPCTPGSTFVATLTWREQQKGSATQLSQTLNIPFIPPATR